MGRVRQDGVNGREDRPSVKAKATRNRANGGIRSLALSRANEADSVTYGAKILKIYLIGKMRRPVYKMKGLTNKAAIKKGLNIGTRRYTGSR